MGRTEGAGTRREDGRGGGGRRGVGAWRGRAAAYPPGWEWGGGGAKAARTRPRPQQRTGRRSGRGPPQTVPRPPMDLGVDGNGVPDWAAAAASDGAAWPPTHPAWMPHRQRRPRARHAPAASADGRRGGRCALAASRCCLHASPPRQHGHSTTVTTALPVSAWLVVEGGGRGGVWAAASDAPPTYVAVPPRRRGCRGSTAAGPGPGAVCPPVGMGGVVGSPPLPPALSPVGWRLPPGCAANRPSPHGRVAACGQPGLARRGRPPPARCCPSPPERASPLTPPPPHPHTSPFCGGVIPSHRAAAGRRPLSPPPPPPPSACVAPPPRPSPAQSRACSPSVALPPPSLQDRHPLAPLRPPPPPSLQGDRRRGSATPAILPPPCSRRPPCVRLA